MISVRPRNITGIMVSGADCDVGQPECFASFVIDNFLRTVPTHRNVVLNGRVAVQGVDEVTKTDLDAFLSAFKHGIKFLEQFEAHLA